MAQQQDFVGKWKKVSTTTCAKSYPDEIEFFAATFLGRKGQSGQRFLIWDAGGYQVLRENLVKIDTASDEQVVYTFSLLDNTLTFTDRNNCTFSYRRVG
jgi:hypothetical protein